MGTLFIRTFSLKKVREKLGAEGKESWVGFFGGQDRVRDSSKRRSKMAGCQLVGNSVFNGIERRNCTCQLSKFSTVPLCYRLPKLPLTDNWAFLTIEGPPDGYRKNVGICLANPSKKIFMASRIYIPNGWQMPQGGANNGEDLRKAAVRELREETGVTSAEFLAEAPYWLTYDFPIKVKNKVNRRWGTNYKGQAQKWFLFKFTGNDEEINLLGDGSEKPEFKEWSWRLPEQVVELAVNFKKPVYEQVLKVFSPYFSLDADEGHSTKNEPNGGKVHKAN
ncbi:nudix hydrolase 27, chloroplastic-like [Durio zibethinus]|uniref:Nudix hydrolase 27, chloroplastic-like n=1 Tax=Durio zibethinus TaxID=66656 RepID=A0A6P6AQA2_DURZI|nr:nudix hydrolase 27, chloroplastic-like [Durio zibethinus]